MAGVQKSFHETPCMLCIAAVLGKVMVTVFVCSCLFTKGGLQSVFQQLPPNRTIRKCSGKKSSRGREKYIDSLVAFLERKVTQVQSVLSVPSPRSFQLGHSVLISRTGKSVNCNRSFNALQAVSFSLPCKPEHTVLSKRHKIYSV